MLLRCSDVASALPSSSSTFVQNALIPLASLLSHFLEVPVTNELIVLLFAVFKKKY